MDSIRRVLGRSSKSTEKLEEVKTEVKHVSPAKSNSMNTTEDDIFSDMLINPAGGTTHTLPSGKNINDIQDLDVGVPSRVADDSSDDEAPSAFGFLNLDRKGDNDAGADESNNFPGVVNPGISQENSKTSLATESLPSADHSDVPSGSESNRSESALVDQERHSISNFSFIREDIPVAATKSCDNIASSPKPSNKRRTRSRAYKPGFGNISVDQPGKLSSGKCPEENTDEESTEHAVDDANSNKDFYESTELRCNTEDESRSSEHLQEVFENKSQINERLQETGGNIIGDKGENKQCDDKTKEDSCATSSETGRDVDFISNLDDSTRMDSDKCTASGKDEDTDSTDITQETSTINLSEIAVNTAHEEVKKEHATRTALPLPVLSSKPVIVVDFDNCNSKVAGSSPDEQLCTTDLIHDSENDAVNVCNTKKTQDEEALSRLEKLQLQEKQIVKSRSNFVVQQKELIEQWRSDHLGENDMQVKIKELADLQLKLVSDEDYDKAAEIDQTIFELTEKCNNYKYQYPLCDTKFLKLMSDFRNLCTHHSEEYDAMLIENRDVMDRLKRKSDEEELSEEKKLNDMTLLLKENKLKVERDLSHTLLDKEHLVKNNAVLTGEIDKLTKELNAEKDGLIEKRNAVRTDIEELMATLAQLQQEENGLTTSIVDVESKIQNIVNEFQPRMDSISNEREAVEGKELNLTIQLDEIAAEEEKIESRNAEISNQREKIHEITATIELSMKQIQVQRESNERELSSFHDLLAFKQLEYEADSDYLRLKEEVEQLQIKLKDTTNKLLANEGKEKRLQRSMNDLEAQLGELQKLKQAHAKDRKFKDAKAASDEIKTLTSEGENLSVDAAKLCETMKVQRNTIEKLYIEISQAEEKFNERDHQHDQYIIEYLKKMNASLNSLLNSHAECWSVGIIELTLSNNNSIIQDLMRKHGLQFNEGDGAAADVDVDAIKRHLVELECALEIAVSEEDWARAEEIDSNIEENKKLIENMLYKETDCVT